MNWSIFDRIESTRGVPLPAIKRQTLSGTENLRKGAFAMTSDKKHLVFRAIVWVSNSKVHYVTDPDDIDTKYDLVNLDFS